MPLRSIKEILMDRDDLSEEEAQDQIDRAQDQMHRYLEIGDIDSAHNICQEYFGLEPDYIHELI